MQLTAHERDILTELTHLLRTEVNAEKIVIYGSAARGELVEGSGIDLLIVLPKISWENEKKVSNLCFDAELKLETNRIISSVCFSRDELMNSPLRGVHV